MEPCSEHSGYRVTLSEHERRLDEYRDNIRRVHERLDDVVAGQTGMEKRIMEKIDEICGTMTPRLDGLERNQRMVWKILCWAGSVMGASVLFFREQLGKFAKWFFFGG